MADEIDGAVAMQQSHLDQALAARRLAAAQIPAGVPGECAQCGDDSPRLVRGHCARCRDGRRQ